MILSIFFYVGIIVVLTGVVTFGIRLLSIIFGWKILRSGRKLASSIPGGADLGSMVSSIKQEFTKIVFGLNNDVAPASPIMQSPSVVAPTPVAQTPQPQVQQPQQQEPQQPPVPMPPSDNSLQK